MSDLVEVNLAQNCIPAIGTSLRKLENLENLNLAANLIDKFEVCIHNKVNLLRLNN